MESANELMMVQVRVQVLMLVVMRVEGAAVLRTAVVLRKLFRY